MLRVRALHYSEYDILPYKKACQQAERFVASLSDNDNEVLAQLIDDNTNTGNGIMYDWIKDRGESTALPVFLYVYKEG